MPKRDGTGPMNQGMLKKTLDAIEKQLEKFEVKP